MGWPRCHPRSVPNANCRSLLHVFHRAISQQDVFHGGLLDCALQSRRVVAETWPATPCNPHQAATDAHRLITLHLSRLRFNLLGSLLGYIAQPELQTGLLTRHFHRAVIRLDFFDSTTSDFFCSSPPILSIFLIPSLTYSY